MHKLLRATAIEYAEYVPLSCDPDDIDICLRLYLVCQNSEAFAKLEKKLTLLLINTDQASLCALPKIVLIRFHYVIKRATTDTWYKPNEILLLVIIRAIRVIQDVSSIRYLEVMLARGASVGYTCNVLSSIQDCLNELRSARSAAVKNSRLLRPLGFKPGPDTTLLRPVNVKFREAKLPLSVEVNENNDEHHAI